MRIWMRMLMEQPATARFVAEVCACDTNFRRQQEKRYDFWCSLCGAPQTKEETDRTRLRATLMAGMLVQMCHAIPTLIIEGDIEDFLDNFFRDYYLHVPDEEELEHAIARARAAAADIRLTVDEDFRVRLVP